MKFARLVLANAFRRKTRAFLTIVSVILVLVLIVALTSLLAALELEDAGGLAANRIYVQHRAGLAQFLPLAYRQKMERIPGVVAVAQEMWFGGTYIDQRPQNFFGQLGTDPSVWPTIFADFRIAPDELAAFQSERNSFIAGRRMIDRYHWKIGDRIQIQGSYVPITLDLVLRGVYHAPDESVIFFHYKSLENTWVGRSGQTGNFVLLARRPEDVSRITAAIDAMFDNSSAPVKAMPEKQFRLQFVEMLGNIKLLIRSISLAVLFTIVLIVANTMAMSARERVVEIAVLRALGFRRNRVFWLVLGEAVALAVLGGVAGVLVSIPFMRLLVDLMKASPAAPFAYNLRVSSSAVVTAFVTSVAIGAFAGFVPALRSARVSVVGGLRQVV